MVPHIPPLPYRKVDRLLRDHGFRPTRQKGSHVFFEHADGRTTVVPNHAGQDIPPGLVRKILKDASLDPDEIR